MRHVDWSSTLVFSAMRIGCASVVVFLFMMIVGGGGAGGGIGAVLYLIVVLPFFVACCGVISMMCGWLGQKGVPFAGLVGIGIGLPLLAGDPLVWLVSKLRPDWIPVADPGFFNPPLVLVNRDA
jgi:ABC-type polysaccharide/polyol phosphate export permease